MFRGVIPPLLTPLTPDRQVDVDSLHRLLDWLLAAGVDGIFALGSSSEAAFLTNQQRDLVLREIVAHVDHKVPVFAGLIDMQTSRVMQNLERAQEIGADVAVATAPFYAITGPAETEQHFRTIARHSSIPLFAYDIPVCVHTKLSPGLLVRLGQDGVLAGVKDSSGDDVSFRRLCMFNEAAGHPLSCLTGHEVVVDGAYLAGADGCVPGLGNVDPLGYIKLDRAMRSADVTEGVAEQNRLARLFEIVFSTHGRVGPTAGIGAFKTALRHLGVIAHNTMSEPMESLGDEEAQAIARIVDAAQIQRPVTTW